MSELTFFHGLLIAWFLMAVVVFIALFFVSAPYGRHARCGWGPAIDNRLGWLVMESVPPVAFGILFALGNNPKNLPALIFLLLWEAHYLHRGFIYPFTLPGRGHRMPVVIMVTGIIFNGGNSYLNGRFLFTFSPGYETDWLVDPRFIAGVILFLAGFSINRRADRILKILRKRGDSGYSIPRGSLYKWISCPNYLGEIITWAGWAVTTWSLAGLAFAAWTAANLVPRARAHHQWYHRNFPDYPKERKILLPKIW